MQANTQPAFFKQGPTPRSQFLVYATLSLVLLVVDHRFHLLNPARELVSVALYPLQWLAHAPVSAMRQAGEFMTAQSLLQRENQRLSDENLQAKALLLRMDSLQAENTRLQALAATQTPSAGGGRLARVLYSSQNPFSARLVVDRGENLGVKRGQIVIDDKGVAGQVTRVQPLTSEITLVTEKNHAVPTQVQRTGLRVIVYGMGPENPMEIRFMPVNADLREGDILVTSGIDGTYPAGLPVASVRHIDRNAGLGFAKIACAPMAQVSSYRYFLILDELQQVPERPPEPPPLPDKPRTRRSRGGEG